MLFSEMYMYILKIPREGGPDIPSAPPLDPRLSVSV